MNLINSEGFIEETSEMIAPAPPWLLDVHACQCFPGHPEEKERERE